MVSFYKDRGFDRIRTSETVLFGEPGAPELPVIHLNYIIPSNAQVESLIITNVSVNQISGLYSLFPAQLISFPGDSVPWVPPDSIIYNSDSLYPGKYLRIIEDGVLDGARLVTIAVYPVQYHPQSKRVYFLRRVDFEFDFSLIPIPDLRPRKRGIFEQRVYDDLFKNTVVNDQEIPAYYQRPSLVEENDLLITGPPGGPPPLAPGVIITDYYFKSAFQAYADWMTDQGVPTVVTTTQQIYGYYPGVDNAEKIRNYITSCWSIAGGTWFILGGDYPVLPIRYACSDDDNYNPAVNCPCDLYFSDLSGNWNWDSDDLWGELTDDHADRYPEVFVGRVTAYNGSEINNWKNKVLTYEQMPMNDFTTALWLVADFGVGDAINRFPAHISHNIKDIIPADMAVDELDVGYGFVTINCHGLPEKFLTSDSQSELDYWVHAYWEGLGTPNDDGLNHLTNSNKYYPVYSFCCLNAAYDPNVPPEYVVTDTCVADAFVDAYSSKGGSAFLGNTRSPQGGYAYLEDEYYNVLFRNGNNAYARLGYAEAQSKLDSRLIWEAQPYRQTIYCHNLFGSPHTEAWTKTPMWFNVSHPTEIPVGLPTEFCVTVTFDGPIQYAKVCLNKSGDIYQVGETNAQGQVTFNITPNTTGTMKVTVTRHHNLDMDYTQYTPSQTLCQVTSGGGPQSHSKARMTPAQLCITELATVFHDKTDITFGVPRKTQVVISVYDVTGTRVKVFCESVIAPGYHRRKIEMDNLPHGVYFLGLQQNKEVVMKKIVLVK